MPGYERHVAYIYQYDGIIKGKNVGFVKAENRDGQGRVELFVRHAYGLDQLALQVRGLRREGGTDVGVRLGTLELADGDGEFVWQDSDAGQPGPFRGVCLCPPGTNRCLAAVWSGEAFDRTRYRGEETETEREERGQEPPQGGEAEAAAGVGETETGEAGTAAAETDEARREPAEPEPMRFVYIPEPDAAPPAGEAALQPPERAVFREAQEVSAARTAETPPARFYSPVWDVLSRRYGKCRPFAEDGGIQCIQLKPADLSRLARAYRSLSGNSFLLHGYYRYNHLLLIRMEAAVFEQRISFGGRSGDSPHYLLGVPGYYQSGEKSMAEMFGFSQFLPASARAGTGDGFGYWCTEVQL